MDQSLLAAPHGFSQRATSFIASWCQGIHRMPFCRSIILTTHQSIEHTLTCYPPCTGTIHQVTCPNLQSRTSPLGTATPKTFIDQNQTRQRLTVPVSEITHMLLNTRTTCAYASRLAPLHGSDNPSTRARTSSRFHVNQCAHPDAPKPIHPDKEQICSSTIKLGANIQSASTSTFAGTKPR